MVDRQLIDKKTSLIKEYINFLIQKRSTISEESLKNNFSLMLEVAYALQTIIQACIDLCTHLASDEEWELPNNAAHAFKIALRHKVITEKVCKELENAVKLRNVIVHQYDELDGAVLEDVVQNKLTIFSGFITEVNQWLKSNS